MNNPTLSNSTMRIHHRDGRHPRNGTEARATRSEHAMRRWITARLQDARNAERARRAYERAAQAAYRRHPCAALAGELEWATALKSQAACEVERLTMQLADIS